MKYIYTVKIMKYTSNICMILLAKFLILFNLGNIFDIFRDRLTSTVPIKVRVKCNTYTS